MKVWIDDVRTPPDADWTWVKSSQDAVSLLRSLSEEGMLWVSREEVSFDHDLGDEDTTRPVLLWMIENSFKFDKYNVHTANPVGREWLEGMIERYLQ